MEKLSRDKLMTLERYAVEREAFRAEVIAHKKARRVAVGPHATLLFEDALTMRYQVQEMLRVERIFEPAAIEEEIATYNPLIPDGRNWKATFLIEYEDVEERAAALARMPGCRGPRLACDRCHARGPTRSPTTTLEPSGSQQDRRGALPALRTRRRTNRGPRIGGNAVTRLASITMKCAAR